MEYKINFRNQLKVLEGITFVGLILTAMVLCLKHYSSTYHEGLELYAFLFWLFSLMPGLYFHIEYLTKNKGAVFKIDKLHQTITYSQKSRKDQVLHFQQLEKIVIYMFPNMYHGSGFRVLPFEDYHYAAIFTKEGDCIVITCLMIRNLNDALQGIQGVPVEKEKTIPSILFNDWRNKISEG